MPKQMLYICYELVQNLKRLSKLMVVMFLQKYDVKLRRVQIKKKTKTKQFRLRIELYCTLEERLNRAQTFQIIILSGVDFL